MTGDLCNRRRVNCENVTVASAFVYSRLFSDFASAMTLASKELPEFSSRRTLKRARKVSEEWSDVTTSPVTAFPFVRTGAYTLINADATYTVSRNLDVAVGFKNVLDQNFQLAWGFPEQGSTFYIKTKVATETGERASSPLPVGDGHRTGRTRA
jgi:hypothetical protein